MTSAAPMLPPDGEGDPRLVATPSDGSAEPFFDSQIPVEAIDLTPLREKAHGFDRPIPNGRKVVRFLTNAASGEIDHALFKTCFAQAAGTMLGSIASREVLADMELETGPEPDYGELYGLLEQVAPRFTALLDRLRAAEFYSPEHMASLTKLCLSFEAHRYAAEHPTE